MRTIPVRMPMWTILGLLVGVLLCAGICWVWLERIATPVQRLYLTKQGRYLYWNTGRPRMPEFGSGGAHREVFFALAKNEGGVMKLATAPGPGVVGEAFVMRPQELHAWLAREIYAGGLEHAARGALWCCGVTFLMCLILGARLDQKRMRLLFVDGVRVRGPEMLTRTEWNKRRKCDGFGLRVR